MLQGNVKCDTRLQTSKTDSGRRAAGSGSKRNEEDNRFRYWFVDREDLELAVRRNEMLEYGDPIST